MKRHRCRERRGARSLHGVRRGRTGPASGSGGTVTRGAGSGGADRALIEGRLGPRGPAPREGRGR